MTSADLKIVLIWNFWPFLMLFVSLELSYTGRKRHRFLILLSFPFFLRAKLRVNFNLDCHQPTVALCQNFLSRWRQCQCKRVRGISHVSWALAQIQLPYQVIASLYRNSLYRLLIAVVVVIVAMLALRQTVATAIFGWVCQEPKNLSFN